MSNFLAIATVTATLQRLVQTTLDVDVPGARATTVRPDGSGNNQLPQQGVNLFLYQVMPNAAWRNADLPTRAPTGRLLQRPRIALDLHYLLTFYGTERELEPQRILGSVVRTLHARPVLTRAAIEATLADPDFDFLAGSDLGDEIETVKLNPLALSLEELSKLWSVFFQTPYNLSVAYTASVVLIEGRETPQPALPVQTRNIFVAPEVQADLPGAAPDALPGLQLWLRSDEGVSYDAAGVSEWADGSGNDFHAVQGDAARRPAFVGHGLAGRPVLRFDGTDDYLAIQGLSYGAGALDGLTVCALVRSDGSDRQIIASFDRDEHWHLALNDDLAPDQNVGWDTTDSTGSDHLLQTTERLTDGQWHLLCTRFERGAAPDKQLFVDGVEVAADSAHGGNALGTGTTRFGFIGVGSQAATADGARGLEWFFAGDLAELAIFHRALTDDERLRLERYIVRRYGS